MQEPITGRNVYCSGPTMTNFLKMEVHMASQTGHPLATNKARTTVHSVTALCGVTMLVGRDRLPCITIIKASKRISNGCRDVQHTSGLQSIQTRRNTGKQGAQTRGTRHIFPSIPTSVAALHACINQAVFFNFW